MSIALKLFQTEYRSKTRHEQHFCLDWWQCSTSGSHIWPTLNLPPWNWLHPAPVNAAQERKKTLSLSLFLSLSHTHRSYAIKEGVSRLKANALAGSSCQCASCQGEHRCDQAPSVKTRDNRPPRLIWEKYCETGCYGSLKYIKKINRTESVRDVQFPTKQQNKTKTKTKKTKTWMSSDSCCCCF